MRTGFWFVQFLVCAVSGLCTVQICSSRHEPLKIIPCATKAIFRRTLNRLHVNMIEILVFYGQK